MKSVNTQNVRQEFSPYLLFMKHESGGLSKPPILKLSIVWLHEVRSGLHHAVRVPG